VTAPQFFVDEIDGELVSLRGDEARHAIRVLRIKPGETITVSDGKGLVADARCESVRGDSFVAHVLHRRRVEPSYPRVVVFPAVPKAGKLDLVVQKLTELGVDEIRPWGAARSVARWDGERARKQGERLRAIAREAAKQSRRAWLPEVPDPAPLQELPSLTVLLHEGASERLSAVLPAEPPRVAGLIVGPEGGLTDDEVADLGERGARPASLGAAILRTETASLAAAALLLGRYGRLG
jgi:16S rRNA (uracil1498-N3)-methyltransferase